MATTRSRTKSKARSSKVMSDVAASHIVVFKKPSEANLDACTQALGLAPENKSIRTGVVSLSAAGKGRGAGKMYQRLAVASLDLDDRSIKKLKDSDAVEEIFPNEIRQIPKPIPEGLDEDQGQQTELVSYLSGVRDGLGIAINYASGQPVMGTDPLSIQSAFKADNRHWALEMIGMGEGYTKFTGQGVKLAVLDTGIDLNHPDFEGRLQEGVNAVSFVPGESVQDGNGHGTHCAGNAAGPLRSLGGRRYGVAPNADLMVGKVLSDAGSGSDSQILDGIDWAASAGASVISMSLGSGRQPGQDYNRLYERVARNLRLSAPGTLIIAASGNESNRPHWVAAVGNPAACPSILAISAVDIQKRVAWFSCSQRDELGEVNLSAPGVNVYSSWTGGGFKAINGTSMATPHVAGVAALYMEKNPALTPDELWQTLENRAIPLGDPRDFGKGLVQAP